MSNLTILFDLQGTIDMAKLAIMNALTEHEKTGDHNHGQGAISPRRSMWSR